ncbi:hypothetical protein [Nocardioides sp. W7]|uniref:hypothetical protein n=1 Tax=Nocardioides sp. W7 TaxID=2931390 RepID=UPI001FD535A5|nr:hypothetical protein [Nocardioides sp. W7]
MTISPEERQQAARGSIGSLVATSLALAWARLWRAEIRYDAGTRLLVATGRGGFGRGVTVGGVFLAGRSSSPALLRHQAVHAEQWAKYGLVFPLRYLLEELGRPGRMNRFEIEAGLKDG